MEEREGGQNMERMEKETLLGFLKSCCQFDFTEEEVAELDNGGFNTKAALAGVTRDDLAPVKLRPAAVKMLVSAFSSGAAAAAAGPGPGSMAAGVPLPQSVRVEPPDQLLDDTLGRVSRLLDKAGNTIGTCCRVGDIERQQLILTARHCVVERGQCLDGLMAFGGSLTFVAASPRLDTVVFRGPRGPGFKLMSAQLYLGTPVSLLSFPMAFDKELELSEGERPALDIGVVSQISSNGQHAVATFGTGMPNSSGGAVVSTTCSLAGLYTGTIWHLQGLGSSSLGSSRRTSSSGGGAQQQPPVLEKDGANMWEDNEVDEVEAAAESDVSTAAQLSCINIPHKSSAAFFVPAAALLNFLQIAGLEEDDPLNTNVTARMRHWKRSSHQR